jgi:ribonuclease HI
MAVAARRIWLRQNAHVFQGIFVHPNEVYNATITSLAEFKRCNKKEPVPHKLGLVEHRSRPTSWTPTPAGVIKVNWDASLNVKKGWTCQGIIARDNNGFCMGARSVEK